MSSHTIDRRGWCQGVLAFTGLAAARVSAAQQKPAVLDPQLDVAIRRGATMEEVAKLKDLRVASRLEPVSSWRAHLS